MFTQEDANHLESIRSATATSILDAVGDAQDVALLDAPALINVGDSMIWNGQVAYMRRLGYRVRYISDMQSYDARRLRKAMPNGGVVLLRGGGNFGDVWVGHQKFREIVARELPDYKIVQLTQSVLFRDSERAALANEVLGSHPDFHLLVRDKLSFERARAQLPDVAASMSYDMAFGWDPGVIAGGSKDRAVVIARDDREASSGLLKASSEWAESFPIAVTDWVRHNEHPAGWNRARAVLKFNGRVLARTGKTPLFPTLPQIYIERRLSYLNNWNVEWATVLFSSARALVVDRLHAHVLASLMGIPHVVLDNDHGKISTVFNAYSGGFSTARYTTSTEEARELLNEMMQREEPTVAPFAVPRFLGMDDPEN